MTELLSFAALQALKDRALAQGKTNLRWRVSKAQFIAITQPRFNMTDEYAVGDFVLRGIPAIVDLSLPPEAVILEEMVPVPFDSVEFVVPEGWK